MKMIFTLALVTLAFHLSGQDKALRSKHYNVEDGVAIEGYDPVSYFSGKPVEGKEEFSFQYNGITYHFASSANRSAFKEDPAKYEPAYGGWCAYAMGKKGEKVKIDPETFKLIDGKVYLFYNFWGNNTLEDWNENENKLKPSADKQWKKYVGP